jgi:hypothetical protein
MYISVTQINGRGVSAEKLSDADIGTPDRQHAFVEL